MWEHPLLEVPEDYGDEVRYFQRIDPDVAIVVSNILPAYHRFLFLQGRNTISRTVFFYVIGATKESARKL